MVVSNFSQRFAKQLGDHPVPVLATLILLSYTKILRTLISVLYVTYLEYPTHDRRCGCTMETLTILVANASHFSSGSVCLSLPFSSIHSCFFFFQWLQVISHLRLFSWVHSARLKPFMMHTMLPTKQNIAIGLDCCLCNYTLFFFLCLPFNSILSVIGPVLTC